MSDRKPIATLTIARIYAQQGKLGQSVEVYERLRAAAPEDTSLAEELAEVKRRLAAEANAPAPDLDSLAVERADEAEASEKPRLRCRWRVSDAGGQRARLVLGSDGQLTLRVAGFPADSDAATRDTTIDSFDGSLLVSPPPGASLVAASVGLLDDEGNFASIAHCDMVQL